MIERLNKLNVKVNIIMTSNKHRFENKNSLINNSINRK